MRVNLTLEGTLGEPLLWPEAACDEAGISFYRRRTVGGEGGKYFYIAALCRVTEDFVDIYLL
ncbi:MAG TPA: hypothetical protein VL588_01420, partial [Bdellovibrionota bacterium]|nr:hypothetical protein [Bdellovibrionota bacterium]